MAVADVWYRGIDGLASYRGRELIRVHRVSKRRHGAGDPVRAGGMLSGPTSDKVDEVRVILTLINSGIAGLKAGPVAHG